VNIYGTSSKPGDLQKLRTFFYNKRSQVFQRAKQSMECGHMELAATDTVRFSAMHSTTTRVLQLYPAVLTALKDVCEQPENFDAAVRAESERPADSAKSLTAELRQFAELHTHNKLELVTVHEKNSVLVLYVVHYREEIGFSFIPSSIGVQNSGDYTNIIYEM